jgi:hypothetical protein
MDVNDIRGYVFTLYERKIPSSPSFADDVVKWKKNGIISIFLSLLVEKKKENIKISFLLSLLLINGVSVLHTTSIHSERKCDEAKILFLIFREKNFFLLLMNFFRNFNAAAHNFCCMCTFLFRWVFTNKYTREEESLSKQITKWEIFVLFVC